MSGRVTELVTNQGYGSGVHVLPFIGQGESRAMAAVDPEAFEVVSQTHPRYNVDDFIRDLQQYMEDVRLYVKGLQPIPLPLNLSDPGQQELYEKIQEAHAMLQKSYQSLRAHVQEIRPHLSDDLMDRFQRMERKPLPDLPQAEAYDNYMPPPAPPVMRSKHEWWDRSSGKKSRTKKQRRRRQSRKTKKSRVVNRRNRSRQCRA